MEYRFCGESGLQLPLISLGMWHNFGFTDNFANMKDIAFKAFENGITHFDLANNYIRLPGSAEENFGKLLKEGLGAHRDEIIVSSKAGHLMWDGSLWRRRLSQIYDGKSESKSEKDGTGVFRHIL